MAFGTGKSIPKQGGSTGVHTQETQTAAGSGRLAGVVSTPGLTPDANKANYKPAAKGGSGTTSAGGPKAFKG